MPLEVLLIVHIDSLVMCSLFYMQHFKATEPSFVLHRFLILGICHYYHHYHILFLFLFFFFLLLVIFLLLLLNSQRF